jgi:hypothetical protein
LLELPDDDLHPPLDPTEAHLHAPEIRLRHDLEASERPPQQARSPMIHPRQRAFRALPESLAAVAQELADLRSQSRCVLPQVANGAPLGGRHVLRRPVLGALE